MGDEGCVPSLFEKYGGLTTISALVHRFYEHVLDDERVSHFFDGTNMERLIAHQTEFVAQVLGGPATMVGRDLGKVHAKLGISDDHYSIVGAHLQTAMEELGVEADDVATVMGVIESVRGQIVAAKPAVRVLVLDDSRAWHVLVKDRLPQGAEVVGVQSGAKARETLGESSFSLIVLDLNMPGESGLEFLAELRRTPGAGKTPVVVCSSLPDPISRARALSLGAADILSKAAPACEIRARIESVLARATKEEDAA